MRKITIILLFICLLLSCSKEKPKLELLPIPEIINKIEEQYKNKFGYNVKIEHYVHIDEGGGGRFRYWIYNENYPNYLYYSVTKNFEANMDWNNIIFDDSGIEFRYFLDGVMISESISDTLEEYFDTDLIVYAHYRGGTRGIFTNSFFPDILFPNSSTRLFIALEPDNEDEIDSYIEKLKVLKETLNTSENEAHFGIWFYIVKDLTQIKYNSDLINMDLSEANGARYDSFVPFDYYPIVK